MKLVALILSFVAQAACVIGLAIPYWLYYNKSGIEVYEGLWEGCSKDGCYRFDSLPLLGKHNGNICRRNKVNYTSPKTAVA